MLKLNKKKLLQTSILTTILLVNTGCIFDAIGGQKKVTPSAQKTLPVPKKPTVTVIATTPKPTSVQQPVVAIAIPSNNTIVPECSDDINSQSACNKGLVQTKELKPKLVTPTGGEVHKLKSFQGHNITIVERSNGYLFPEFKNKIVILEMFGKNCSHCIKEMPVMNKLHSKYRGKLEIIALQVEGKMSNMQANALIRRHKIKYPLIQGDTATNLQYHVQNTYGWTGILPFIMVIKNGVTEFTYRGQVSYKEINNDIRSILK
jgi:thiol-disulfide isomerase/thioredoxin